MKKQICLLALGFILSACQAKPTSHAQGGVDGSGGDTVGTQYATFKWHGSSLIKLMDRSLARIEKLSNQRAGNLDPIVAEYGDPKRKARQTLQRVRWVFSETNCSSAGGDKGGSASVANLEICLGYESFKHMSEEQTSLQMLALAHHELSHLIGFNEQEAVLLQERLYGENFERGSVLTGSYFWQLQEQASRIVYDIAFTPARWMDDISENRSAPLQASHFCSGTVFATSIGMLPQIDPYATKLIETQARIQILRDRVCGTSISVSDFLHSADITQLLFLFEQTIDIYRDVAELSPPPWTGDAKDFMGYAMIDQYYKSKAELGL